MNGGWPVRLAWLGGLFGLLAALVVFAPARWLANSVTSATGGQLQLVNARGTVWDGDVAGDWIRRDDDPTMFWTAVSLIFTMALLVIGVGAITGYASRPL